MTEFTRLLDHRLASEAAETPRLDTHPAVLRAALVRALQAPAAAFRLIDVAPLSRLVLSRQRAEWRSQELS
jgi:hypothetical protein